MTTGKSRKAAFVKLSIRLVFASAERALILGTSKK
jgi:hypothetical protein